jgi:hypothetical protein
LSSISTAADRRLLAMASAHGDGDHLPVPAWSVNFSD